MLFSFIFFFLLFPFLVFQWLHSDAHKAYCHFSTAIYLTRQYELYKQPDLSPMDTILRSFSSLFHNQLLASRIATTLQEPIHFGVNASFLTSDGFLTRTQSSIVYDLNGSGSVNLHRSERSGCTESICIIFLSWTLVCWNSLSIRRNNSIVFMTVEEIRFGEVGSIMSYGK